MRKTISLSVIMIIFSVIAFCAINVSAETYKDLTYVLSNEEVTITSCDADAIDIVIPEEIGGYPVTYIEKFAFRDCAKLKNITIPESMKNIGDCAFEGCNSLNNVYISNMANWCNIDFYIMASNPLCYAENLYLNGELVEILEIPSGITEIKNFAFVNYDKLTSVILPRGIKRIGDAAFNCCDRLASINIPDGVESIGNSAFLGCTSLKSIELPDSITDISISAFRECSSLTKAILSNNITNIPMRTFAECTSLVDIIIPEGVTIIGRGAFEECTNLIDITIPHTLTIIYYNAFGNCSNLETVRYNGTEDEWNSMTIGAGNSFIIDSDIVYVARTETIVSEDGKVFIVDIFNAKEQNVVILALYAGDRFVELQYAAYEGKSIPFTITKSYEEAKVMVWDNFTNLNPVSGVEIIK